MLDKFVWSTYSFISININALFHFNSWSPPRAFLRNFKKSAVLFRFWFFLHFFYSIWLLSQRQTLQVSTWRRWGHQRLGRWHWGYESWRQTKADNSSTDGLRCKRRSPRHSSQLSFSLRSRMQSSQLTFLVS